ncbi:LuxR family transcriptional regulator, maltose regulon positive regulatory protein [Nocardioides terrae]|uniref:LuxR family transcriptional regulator, maltose regulon positive regulatory protein n=1 Tax=Nocardioides terrae TaxID=574651 RepID=A0A1I1F332_9ACTN|nr:LuxR C-terminal-related transcriptional regulator [Nocardioides terrae]SFB92148.1 LuxR family transcriptional regulator, maltose regulon positive regulatory protein [Nocardioides terrae]
MTTTPVAGPFLPRPHLLDRIARGARLTVLRAPAGFGKTVLLRQWVDRDLDGGSLLVGVRVRPGEGDPGSFWISMMEALTDRGLPEPSTSHLRSPQSSAARIISAAGRPLVLYVDGFENVATPAAEGALLDLVRHVPDLRLVVATRSHRHFGARVTSGLTVTELTGEDLLFSDQETAALAEVVDGAPSTPPHLAALREASGGWPELTRAMLEALRHAPADGAEVPGLLEQVAAEWLRDRLLPSVAEPEAMRFAAVTALPDEVNADLAGLLTADPAAAPRFEALVAAGGLVPVGTRGAGSMYRWPAAVRRSLIDDLHRHQSEHLPELDRRLARWYADHDRPAEALAHAVSAAAWPLVVEIVDGSWRLLLDSHGRALEEALLAVPTTEILGDSSVGPARALRALVLGIDDPALSAAILPAEPDDLARLGATDAAITALGTGMAVLSALRTPPRLPEAVVLAERLAQLAATAREARPGEVADLYGSVRLEVGETYLAAGDLRRSITHLEEASRRSSGSPGRPEGHAAARLALAHALHGDVLDASSWLQPPTAERATDDRTRLGDRLDRGVARLLLAVDTLDLPSARRAERELRGSAVPGARWGHQLYARALLAVHTGTSAGVLQQIDAARRRRSTVSESAAPLLAAVEAELLLALGQGNQARAVLQGEHRRSPSLKVARARLALLSGDATTALALTGDAGWERRACYRHRQEMLLLRAVAAHRSGEAAAATDALREAVLAARTTGAIRPFSTVPRADLAELAAGLPAAVELLAEEPLAGAPDVFARPITLVELTPREQVVLDRIAEGLSIRQVAVDLRVSYSTVRTQQRSLYRKLGVESQQDAVARARAAGLISGRRQP